MSVCHVDHMLREQNAQLAVPKQKGLPSKRSDATFPLLNLSSLIEKGTRFI
jgi:hypothetical protein